MSLLTPSQGASRPRDPGPRVASPTLLGCAGLWLWAALLGALPVHAQSPLIVQPVTPGQIRIDGALSEWRNAAFNRLGTAADGSAEVALAHDAQGLYIGARVRDDAFVRSAKFGAREDALIASLAFPHRDAFAACELWLFAGEQGRSAAQVQMRSARSAPLRRLIEGVQVVEGPTPTGYALEAFVPWNQCAGGEAWPFARGEVYLHDADPGVAARLVAAGAAPIQTEALPWLSFEGGASQVIARFLRERSLEHARPALEIVADVRGDARLERVIVVGTFAVVGGADGRVDFADLPIRSANELTRAAAIDLTGDTKPELTLHVKQPDEAGSRELVRVIGLDGQSPAPLFAVETRRSTRDGFVSARLEFERASRGPMRLAIRGAEARGLSPDNYREQPASDVVPVALPWGPWLERTYAWDGQRFALLSERPNPKARSVAPTLASAAPPPRSRESTERTDPPAEPSAQVDGPAALAEYKRARGVAPDVPGRFGQQANVAGDAQPETLAVYGPELVVTGNALGGDTGYFFLGLPVRDPADVLGLQTADVTGDGRRDVFVRVRQRIGDVQRELLFCYTLRAQAAQQLLAVEVSRTRGSQRIDNRWSLVPDNRRAVLTIEPGTARGWSAKDYPFVSEAAGGVAPLLLPWKDRTTRYVFERDQLVRDPRTND